MPKYKVLYAPPRRWSEGWKEGDIIDMDEEAAKLAVQQKHLEYLPGGYFPLKEGIIKNKNIKSFVNLEESKLRELALECGEYYFKGEELLQFKNNLEKLLEQVKKPLVKDYERVEVIILTIHNDRKELLKVIEGLLKTEYPFKLTIYENSLNSMNTSKIWNKLIKESTCDYVLIIDSDAFPQNDILTPMIKVLETHQDAAVAGPIGGNSAVPSYQAIPYSESEAIPFKGQMSGYCMLFNKKIFDKIGYFDEDFIFYGQDSDWMERMLEAGFKAYIVPSAYVIHGTATENSIASTRLGNKFDKTNDIRYGQLLWRAKKYLRNKI